MTDYQIQGSTRRCARTGREIRPGERYYSVLSDTGTALVREDYSQDGWTGPPAGAFAHWAGKMPKDSKPRRPPVDDDLLVECLTRLEGDTTADRVSFRYVLALLLMRRKRLRLEEVVNRDGGEVLIMRDVKGGARHEVADPGLDEGELESVQDEVFRVLGWE
jgi:hypothetical protein